MASIPIVSGGALPVFATDLSNGTPAQTANIASLGTINFAGPKLDFFAITANSSLAAAGAANANGFISNTLTSIQQTTTVAMYQVNPQGAANVVLNIAVYPTGAANTASILAAAQAANATGGLNIGYTGCTGNATFTTMNYATGQIITPA
jgi:hypothetical protein